MIVYSIIQKSQLEGALRLDAEYYQPEYLKGAKELKNTKKIGELVSDIRYGLYVEPEYLEEGVDFIRALNLLSFWIDGEILKINEEKVLPFYRLKVGDLLIVRSGANTGCVGIIYPRFENATFGSYTIRLRFNKINPFFVAIFLNSKYGFLQTHRWQTGMAQPNLNIPNIKEIKIPIISENKQKEFEKLCWEIEKFRETSESLYTQAENLLLEELGLKNFEAQEDLSYIVNLSGVKSAHRADAEYFQPKYEKILNQARKRSELVKISEIATVKRGSLIDPKFYNETEGTPYIRGKDFSHGYLEKTSLVYISPDFKSKKETVVKGGDIVFASIGSVGTSALVPEEFSNSFISNNTGKISIKDKEKLLPEYLAILLHSIVGKLQFEKESSQTAQPKISDSQVRNFKISILPKFIQQRIAELVQKSHKARVKAKQLLEQAKNKVENLLK